jgi:hypothetical protein
MSVTEFENRVLQIQQQVADDANREARQLIATGELVPRNAEDYARTVGARMDEQARRALRDFGVREGLPDSSASNLFAVNRLIRGGGYSGIPDLRLGNNLISDVSLTHKNGDTEQLRNWNVIRPNDTVIIRPTDLGGPYVIPRSTIRPPSSGGSK